MTNPAVSVLTATWNRCHVLHRAYDSLERQSVKDFEWVVVDDGSTDETPALMARWQAIASFPIIYYRYTNNRGKTPALNVGRKLISGDYMLPLDSDDALLEDAMETFSYWRSETGIDTMHDISGLAFRLVDDTGKLVGNVNGIECLSETLLEMTNREARYRCGMTFDFVRVTKTRLFRAHDAQELTNSENVPPRLYWNKLSDRYRTIYVDRPILCYYRNDGEVRLSDKATPETVKWPRGRYLRALSILNEDIDWLRHDPKVFLNAARKVVRLGLHIGRSPQRQFRDLAHARARLLWIAGIPGGLVGYIRDRLRGRRAPQADSDISAWGPAAPPDNPMLYPAPERFHSVMAEETTLPGWPR